jgi:hypothetical protein
MGYAKKEPLKLFLKKKQHLEPLRCKISSIPPTCPPRPKKTPQPKPLGSKSSSMPFTTIF